MRSKHRILLLAGVAAAASAAVAQPVQKVTGPVATYWMSAQTSTGFSLGGMGGGGRPSMGAMMGAMMGRGGPQHTLTLQLGSARRPPGEPDAEHVPPAGLGAGSSLPLVTPQAPPPTERTEEEAPSVPREYQKPRGRMLIFWGCGPHARPGQPLVIDFAQMSAGHMPAGLAQAMAGFNLRPMQPPSPGRDTTYGAWPNEKTRTTVPGDGSLVGDHMVRGDYTPDINFRLDPSQDFLAPLELTTNAKNPGGWADLAWNSIPGARAYLATAIGGGQGDQVVLWTSSEVQASAFALPDYIAPGDLVRLVASHALMGPQTTTCAVPKEVVDAAPQAMLQMAAYGGEANFVYPPRPPDPKVTWNKVWQVKVRYRSSTGGLLGMAMPGGRGGDDDRRSDRGQPQQQQPQQRTDPRAAILRGLGGGLHVPGF